MKRKTLLAPSLLSADFSKLRDEIKDVEAAGADWIHVDVMDGHFVPNLTIGPLIVEAIRPHTKLPLDCHLMVSRPQDWIGAFAKAGADLITVHVEAAPHLNRLLAQIKEAGCKAGVSVNPGTSLAVLEEVLDQVDLILLMSVNPGFGGQSFIESSLLKAERLSEARGDLPFLIEMDGGLNAETIGRARKAGVDVFVAGSAVFGAKDRKAAMAKLRAAIKD
ncbi:MAG TPA: ribulose-phosphate 3-epimerase [Bdellovibrionota bacterium]|nr:ribulose-phosphate 3-epimerase [Bdellovibrionota bacterium]